jgi:hypothetical protein
MNESDLIMNIFGITDYRDIINDNKQIYINDVKDYDKVKSERERKNDVLRFKLNDPEEIQNEDQEIMIENEDLE